MPVHKGSCHCRAVQFTFTAPAVVDVTECDCSMCTMSGHQHVIIPQADLTFESGKDSLTLYTFNTGAAKHYHCKTCGVKPLYVPRSHPDCYSVNYRCVAEGTLSVGEKTLFGGKNWEANIAKLRKGGK
eukprot:Plantae.Rhodophyta-Palmaria_palmata.ctg4337.p1 GENE.Plantae.Rhodophyta-Palmaria_palmata.ctg4337~~Plantae.Rhodophyta-Palmaria_palmata.ctg4337.p1  ORF type:complete len:128 (-),score=10.42 Plantae.Rhodophyta-Palmaria_palmata.ctg4337:65-448(-)